MKKACNDEPLMGGGDAVRGRPRPPFLRALGSDDLPAHVQIDGHTYALVEQYKHDSWAATGLYAGRHGRVVCKFGRRAPLAGLPLAWLGRFLACRERAILRRLADLACVPDESGPVLIDGRPDRGVVAHEFIEGRPLRRGDAVSATFFGELRLALAAMHNRRVAYVDLHKRSNILVGADGHPYLVDFQISFRLPPGRSGRIWPLSWLFRLLVASDMYHLSKHVARNAAARGLATEAAATPPWWIRLHRLIGRPLRSLRRRTLVALGVRRGDGGEETEHAPEAAVQLDRQDLPQLGIHDRDENPWQRAA